MAARRRSVFRERHSVCAMLAERSTHAYREMCLRSGQRWQFGPTPNALERSTRPVLRWNTHEPTFQLAENMSVGARTGRPSPFRFSRWGSRSSTLRHSRHGIGVCPQANAGLGLSGEPREEPRKRQIPPGIARRLGAAGSKEWRGAIWRARLRGSGSCAPATASARDPFG